MDSAPQQSRVLKFGVFEVDLELGELRKSGLRIKLVGQPFEVLRVLVERPQQLVAREELQKHLWPKNTFVDYDLGLKKAVNRIREVLGDDAESPRFIETIPRRGYRFIAPVNVNGKAVGVAELPLDESQQRQHRLRSALLLATAISAVVLTVLGLVSGKLFRRGTTAEATPAIRSLAVLPLQNLTNDAAQEYLSDGMTDALITDLAQIGSLKVISRTSSVQYKQTRKSLPEIARELNVDGIVEGTVQRYGDRVRITAQLIYAPEDKHLWASAYERDMQDVFALERDITGDIAHQVKAQLGARTKASPAQPRLLDPKVMDAYLQGNFHLNKYGSGSGDEEKRKAAELFQQVIVAAPDFAPGYVGMAQAHLNLEQTTSEDSAVAKRAAEQAVQLEPNSSDAWVILAEMNDENFWNWVEAEADYRKAISLNPNNALARDLFGEFLGEMGRLDEGLGECELAQQLDPNDDHLRLILYLRREYDRAIGVIQVMVKSHPDNGSLHLTLYQVYTKKEMYKEAVQELVHGLRLFGLGDPATRIDRAFVRSGYAGAIRQLAKELEHLHDTKHGFFPGNLALTYATLGEKDRAFYWLEQAYQHHGVVGTDVPLPFLIRDPMADPLRSDPRFAHLVNRLGLPR